MNEHEFRTGKGVVHGEPSRHYISNALRTLSPEWHGDKVAINQFKGRVNGAIDALNKLDQLKKTLFYGRDNNLIAEGQKDACDLCNLVAGGSHNGADVIHAILGIATQAGELLEALRGDYNSDGFDPINLREEVGYLFWYLAILADRVGFSFEDAQRVNINKLRSRYPDKFNATNAVERDLAAERAVLEDANEPLVDEAMRDEGDLLTISPEETAAFNAKYGNRPSSQSEKLGIVPSKPASGPNEVAQAHSERDTAFNRVQSVQDGFVEQSTSDLGGELSKSIAERKAPLPNEKLARQPVDPRKK